MGPISDAAGQELLWLQPVAPKREHELRAGDDLLHADDAAAASTGATVAVVSTT